MKSAMEVIAEMFVKGLEAMEEKDQTKYCKSMFGKTVQVTFLNFEETILFHFEEMEIDGKRKKWMRYEAHSYPEVRCKSCGWHGFYGDLPKDKRDLISGTKDVDASSAVVQLAEMTGFETVVRCPSCQSMNLQWRHWTHADTDVTLFCRSHWDIGNFGTIMMGPVTARLKGMWFAVTGLLMGWISIKPISKIFTVLKFATLLL